MRIALHTRVRPDSIEAYESAHTEVPPALLDAIHAGGAHHWTIWRSGNDLFHVIDCDDYSQLLASLHTLPVNVTWQARMATMLESSHDYSSEGSAAVLPVVWDLDAT